MVAPGRWFIHRALLALKFLSGYVHRGTLPQSRIRSTAPSEREPGMGAHHSTCRPEAGTLRAIFIAPTKLRMSYVPPFTGVHSLSLAFARQLPQRGSRDWCVPFNVPPGSRNVAGDFHRPYETQDGLRSTVHRGTLPQSRIRSTAPSEREPGGACTIHPTARKPERGGRFSSPLRDSEYFTFRRSLGVRCGYGISIQFNLNTKM